MKKTITIKSKKLLVESSLKIGDVDYEKKLRKRIVDLSRARDLAQTALNTAEENEQADLAAKLKTKINELDDLLATYNADSVDTEDETDGKGAATSEEDRDADSGDDEQYGKDSEEDSDSDDETEDADETDNGSGKKKDTDSDDSDGDGNGDPEESDEEDESTESESKKEDNDSGEDGKGDPGTSKKKNNSDDGDSADENGNDDPDAQKDDGDTGDSDRDDGDSDGEDEDESSDSDEDSGSSKSKGSKSKKSDAGDTDSDGDDSEDDGDSENDSQNQSDGQSAQSKTKPSLDPNDSNNSNSNAQPEFKNPFADEEDIPSGLGSMNMDGTPPRDATTDETIELLKTLKGEGRKGAIDALKDLIAKRENGNANESFQSTSKKSLTEAIKGVRDMTDDEFGDYINGVYDLIDQVTPVNYVDDIEDRKQKIGRWSQDPLVAQELQAEDSLEIQKDYQQKKARAAAKARYSSMGSLQDFQMDFYSAINNQIETIRQEYQSYDEINVEYESEDAIMKADLEKELPAEAIPIVDVYFDVSGSWGNNDIKLGEAAVASVKVFEDQGELVMNIFYFSNGVDNISLEHCRATYGTGTLAWPDILQNIKATGAKNVLIMTDNDFETLDSPSHYGGKYGPSKNGSIAVEGCVWYLWKNGQSSPSCIKKLNGRQGTYQYSFNA